MNRVLLFSAIATILTVAGVQASAAPSAGWQDPTTGQAAAQKSAASVPSKPGDKKEEDCGCEAKTPPDAFAIVNGVKVATKDVDEPIKDNLQELRTQVIAARKRQLDLEINSRLLEAEARRLGVAPEKLLEREVKQKVKEPTELEARTLYDQNKSNIEGEFKDIKDQIIGYLRNKRQQDEAKKFADRLRLSAQVKVLVDNVTPPDTDADRARVLATVNGKRVTSGDVEDALKPLVFSVQEQVYDLRKRSLDVKINDLLLEEAAKKKNMSGSALFDAEILPRVKRVTEDDARKFFEENKGEIKGTFPEVQLQIIQYLENRERVAAEAAYAEELRKGAAVEVFLKPPEPPVLDISIEDRPWTGGANASVTIVEFTDFECPSCAATQPVLEEVVKEFGDRVKLVAHSFPLDQHKHAFKAAEAAEAAREQGKYWEYATLLFKNQKELEADKLKEYASQAGLDRKRFDAALDSSRFADKVKHELSEGDRVGIDSTPSIFVNGKRVRERTREALKSAIEAAFKDAAKK